MSTTSVVLTPSKKKRGRPAKSAVKLTVVKKSKGRSPAKQVTIQRLELVEKLKKLIQHNKSKREQKSITASAPAKKRGRPPKFIKTTKTKTKDTIKTRKPGSDVETVEIRYFNTATAKVTVMLGRTLSDGNYGSFKMDTGITLPCYVEEIETTFNQALTFCKKKVLEIEKTMFAPQSVTIPPSAPVINPPPILPDNLIPCATNANEPPKAIPTNNNTAATPSPIKTTISNIEEEIENDLSF